MRKLDLSYFIITRARSWQLRRQRKVLPNSTMEKELSMMKTFQHKREGEGGHVCLLHILALYSCIFCARSLGCLLSEGSHNRNNYTGSGSTNLMASCCLLHYLLLLPYIHMITTSNKHQNTHMHNYRGQSSFCMIFRNGHVHAEKDVEPTWTAQSWGLRQLCLGVWTRVVSALKIEPFR